jgi:hypothetical protein
MSSASLNRPEKLLPAFALGVLAGFVGSLVAVVFELDGLLAMVLTYGIPSFAAACTAIQSARSRGLQVWGLLSGGIAVGVALSVLVHPSIGSTGERNLWPFEALMFNVVGLGPIWLGIYLGRLLPPRVSDAPYNDR